MASGYDESVELFQIVNGSVSDFHRELKTFTELKPVRLPFQHKSYIQESYDDYQDNAQDNAHASNDDNYSNGSHDTPGWVSDDINLTTLEFSAEKLDTEPSTYESQLMCNQEFFNKLDEALCNLLRELYTDRLIEQTNNCEDTISMYRNILAKRARQSEKCPNGPLYTRRTTKLETSSKRYANDCYAFQSFIDNDDPKVLNETIVKKRTTIKSEPYCPTTPNIDTSSTTKIEIAELKSQVLELKGTINTLKTEQTKDRTSISNLQKSVHDLLEDLNKTKKLLEKQTELTKTLQNNNAQTNSLFENIKRQNQKQKDDEEQQRPQIHDKTQASENIPKSVPVIEKTQNTNVQNEVQVRSKPIKPMNDKSIENKTTKTNTNDSTDKSKADSNGSKQVVQSENPSKKFDGNYAEALTGASIKEQAAAKSTASGSSSEEIKRFGAKRDLYLYYTTDGHPRFGRGAEQQVSETLSGDTINEHSQTTQTIEDESEIQYISPPKNIPVRYTNRNQGSDLTNKFETRKQPSSYQNRSTKFQTKSNRNFVSARQTTDANTFAKELYTDEQPAFGQMEPEEPIFESVVRRKTIRYYIGNIGQKSNRAGLLSFLKEYGVEPVGARIIETHRGHLSAKITVYASDRYMLESGITWPKKMYCRRWYGMQQWNAKSDNTDQYNEDYQNDYEAYGVD